ncbi:hypothetical protein NFI96_022290, partial [Prochilodus magdalenae]
MGQPSKFFNIHQFRQRSNTLLCEVILIMKTTTLPQVLYPVQTGGSLVAEMCAPFSRCWLSGHTKVVAVDVDSGQNAWLSYKLQRATDRALFEVGPQNGERYGLWLCA